MKLRFVVKTALKLYRRNFGQAVIVISASFFVTLAFIIASASYFISLNEFSKYRGNFTITIVFNRNISENMLTRQLVDIKNHPGISGIVLTRPDEALKEFKAEFGEEGSDILTASAFQPIATAYIDNSISDRKAFSALTRSLNNNFEADEIIYKSDYVNSFFHLKDKFYFIYIFLNVVVFLGLSFFVFIVLKRIYRSHQSDYLLMLSLGAGKILGIIPQLLFILYTSLIGIVIGLGASLVVWFLVSGTFLWNTVDYNVVFLAGLVLAFSFIFVMTIMSGIFSLNRQRA